MKRKGIFVLLLVLMSASVFAAVSENITSEFGAIRGTIDQTTENVMEREIVFPEAITPMTSFLFGETISFERLIVLIGIWIALFILIKGAVGFIPMFDSEKIQIGVSAVVALLILITGTIDDLAANYFGYLSTFKLLENSGALRIFTGIFFLAFVVFALDKLFKKMNVEKAFLQAEVVGERIALVSAIGKEMDQGMNEESSDYVTPSKPFWRK